MNKQQNNDLTRRLAMYSVAAGAAVGLSGNAHALLQITAGSTVVTADGTVGSPDSQYFNIDIDGDTVNDFQLLVKDDSTGTSGYIWLTGINGGLNAVHTDTPGGCTGNFAASVATETVGSSAQNFNSPAIILDEATGCSNFPLDVTDTVGLRFEISGMKHYGWLQITRSVGSTVVTLDYSAFETEEDMPVSAAPGMPVGAATPAAIGLLAIGAAALRRRRRKLN